MIAESKKRRRNTAALLAIGLQLLNGFAEEPSHQPVKRTPEEAIGEIELLVTDPDGKPIENAVVKAGFYMPRPYPSQKSKTETDENGRCVVTGRTRNEISYWIQKDGYYDSKGIYSCPHAARNEEPRIKNGYWQPRKPTVAVELRPIRNPIPMYVKKGSTGVPKADEVLGYDMLKGDWLVPHANGKKADITIRVKGEYKTPSHRWAELKLRFPNEHDGLIPVIVSDEKYGNESEYQLPFYQAPEDGYKREYTHFFRIHEKDSRNMKERKDIHYVFRIRTEVDEDGNIVEAMYGKVYGEIRGGFSWGGPSVGFTYYLNPTGTRNLEYDPPKNLFLQKDDGTFWRPSSPYARKHDEYIRGKP